MNLDKRNNNEIIENLLDSLEFLKGNTVSVKQMVSCNIYFL